MSDTKIEIRNARTHNLKNVNVDIPHNKFITISGLSGSGKSSLAFDTLFAEGQRRYVESLSAYIRQFLGRMNKPEVDYINGLPPAIAIEQKVISNNPRSTVGTSTEIYEYLKLLFARIGKTVSPVSGCIVQRHNIKDVIDFIIGLPPDTEVYLLSPIILSEGRTIDEYLQVSQQQGFSRIFIDGTAVRINTFLEDKKAYKETPKLLIDRIKNDKRKETENRLADSVQVAFFEGHDTCEVVYFTDGTAHSKTFSQAFEADGTTFREPSVEMFSFNSPAGACPKCEGFGKTIGISPDLVVPDKSLSIYQDAVSCWKGESGKEWKQALILNAEKCGFPIHKPYCELTDKQINMLWEGNQYFGGINQYFDFVESQQYKIQYRVIMARYRALTLCPMCKGTRLKPDAANVKLFFKKR